MGSTPILATNLKLNIMKAIKEVSLKLTIGTIVAFIIAACILLFAHVLELAAAFGG